MALRNVFRKFQPLDRKLPLLVSSLVLTTVGFFAWAGYSQFSTTLYATSSHRLTSAARLVSSLVAQSVPRWRTQLSAVAIDPAVIAFLRTGERRSDALAAIERSNAARSPGRWRTRLLDTGGRTVLDRRWHSGVSSLAWADSQVRAGRAVDSMLVSPIFAIAGTPVYQLLVPVYAEGAARDAGARPIGFVADTRAMVEGTQAAIRGLIGDSVTMLIGQREAGVWTDLVRAMPAPPMPSSDTTPVAFQRSAYGAGLGVAREIPGTPWSIWLQQPRALILAPVNDFERRTVPIGALIALVGALLGWLVSHRIARRIVTLTNQAEQIIPESTDGSAATNGSFDEVDRLSDAFDRMSARVATHRELESKLRQAQKLEAVGRLAGGIAHDFNNILTVIRNYTEFVREELPKDSSVAADIDQILTATDRAASLTGQLLAFSRNQVVSPKVIDLNSIIADAEDMLRRVVPSNIELITQLDDDAGNVLADRGQMEQILLNLTINAADAMPDGGTLSIRTQHVRLDGSFALQGESLIPGKYASIVVTDTGGGMDRDTITKIFDPFFTTKEVGRGTGLGLATVHGIVKQGGGHIRVYSEPGHGTTFKIYLPQIAREVSETHEIARLRDESPVTETILLAEDDEQTREVTRRILTRRGYTVLPAHDGNQAVALAESHPGPIHLVLSDMMMPGLRGGDLALHIKRLRPEAAFLLMSGYSSPDMMRRNLMHSSLEFIEKPFTQEGLLARIRTAINGVAERSAA